MKLIIRSWIYIKKFYCRNLILRKIYDKKLRFLTCLKFKNSIFQKSKHETNFYVLLKRKNQICRILKILDLNKCSQRRYSLCFMGKVCVSGIKKFLSWIFISTVELLWLNIKPNAKIHNNNDVIIIKSIKMISASIKSELIL